MRQVRIDQYDRGNTGESDETDCRKDSIPTESQLAKRSVAMQTQYSSPSRESSIYCSDDRSTPSPPSNDDDNREQNVTSEQSNTNFLTIRLNHPCGRRKVSTCSETSSIDSASLSTDGSSDVERNSICCPAEYDGTPDSANKFDDIIDKIVELRFSRNARNSETNEFDGRSNASDSVNSETIGVNGKIIVGGNRDVNWNYDSGRKTDDSEYSDNVQTEDDDDCGPDGDEDVDDLVERGPVRHSSNGQFRHGKPYYTLDWLAGTSENLPDHQSYASVYESTAEQILRNKQFSEKINPCLDKLSDYGQTDENCFNIAGNGWGSPERNYIDNGTPNSNTSSEDVINPSIPSIVLNDPGEASLLEILASGGFQAAQSLSDTASLQNPSPGAASSENWPDSPTSSCNPLSSRSHSRASSRAQSPGSGANVGSPLQHVNIGESPNESRSNPQNFRIRQTLSSSESSNHSYADTPSPTNYQCSIDHRVEERLGLDFENFSTWCQNWMSTETVVNTVENVDVSFDSNELQLVEEVIRRDQSVKTKKINDMQVVPKSQTVVGKYDNYPRRVSENDLVPNPTTVRRDSEKMGIVDNVYDESSAPNQTACKIKTVNVKNCPITVNDRPYDGCGIPQLSNTGILISNAQNNLVYPDLDDVYNLTYSDCMHGNVYNDNPMNSTESLMDFENSMENFLASNYNGTTTNVDNSTINDSTGVVAPVDPITPNPRLNDLTQINGAHDGTAEAWRGREGEPSKTTFNDFQIPETVTSYRQNRTRRTSERSIAPWPSLNLPLTGASERLKAGLDPKDVEKAMINLLKKPTEQLAAGDEDGDTMLMCLVGNPSELDKKKAYLAPLVERLGSLTGALTMTNKRNEDALYLAAVNCPQMAYVTGYLAAAMLQRGIDVSQRLYNTKGDTLIHAVAAKGDTHGAVLAELLSLRTVQGNAVFDLSKRNYDGRTPLHVAVESHGQTVLGVSSIGVTRLLLENGADPSMKETKCGNTALHMAISLCRDPNLVKALLNNNGHDAVHLSNYNNNTPLHMAAALTSDVSIERHMEICMHLIRAGASTNVQNRHGKTPLALVCPERKNAIRQIFHKKA